MDIYKEIEARERAEFEQERRNQLEENEYKRKRDLESLKEKYYGKSKGGKGIEIEYQKSLEEQKEIEKEILRKKEELRKLEKDSELRKFQTALVGERKFFFSLLFLGLLILAIFCLFKNPLYFPGLTNKVFWSLIILALIIMLYYMRFFDFLKNVNSLNNVNSLKNVNALNKEYIKSREEKPIKTEKSYNFDKEYIKSKEEKPIKTEKINNFDNFSKEARENKSKEEKRQEKGDISKKVKEPNINNIIKKERGKGFFSRIVNNLADK